MNFAFEWDEEKANSNFKKHKISFEEGITIFKTKKEIEDMLPEYDFTKMKGGIRGSDVRSRCTRVFSKFRSGEQSVTLSHPANDEKE